MKKLNNILKFLPVLLLLLVTSCKKELNLGNLEVTGTLEQPAVDDADAKNYLAYERYIYWETGDKIHLFSGDNCDADDEYQSRTVAFNPNTSDPKFGSCSFREFNLSSAYYAIYPASCAVCEDDYYKEYIDMPTSYNYREDDHADYSYGKPGMPMVAWVSTTDDNYKLNLDFHSVCGIARIQMYASGASASKTISSIVFTECSDLVTGATCNPISGRFQIHDMTTNAPSLEKATSNSSTGTTITVTNINKVVNSQNLFTFYLPLPALYGATNNIATYYIKATVNFTNASKTAISKAFRVDIRRNTLSYLKAIDLDGEGVSSQGMVGDGTQLRPFQIYTVDDLKTMREAFSHVSTKGTSATINGKTVTKDTYFRLVNSQIVLSASSTDANYWASGITNFTGHFICANGNPTTMGIENNSNAPIFESITKDGHVEGLYVRGDHTYNGTRSAFSPLCAENTGTLNNCQNYCKLSGSNNLAGICVDNYGEITNAANKAVITTNYSSGHAAGVCLTNHENATISGYGISASAVDGAEAAAICHNNQGTVEDCQVTYNNIHLKGKIGGIVYVNNGTIDHCEVVGDVLQTENIAGGICCINNDNGIVNGCGNGLVLLSGRVHVGGIVAEQTTATAEIRNCCNIGPKTAEVALNASSSNNASGGIIGYLTAGHVYNCLCNLEVQSTNATYYGTIVGYNGGNSANIANCFDGSKTSKFYGETLGSGMGENCFTSVKDTKHTKLYNSEGYIVGESGTTVVDALNTWVNEQSSKVYYLWTGTIPSLTNNPPATSKHRRK